MREMFQPAFNLLGTLNIHTAHIDLARCLHHRLSATGTFRGHFKTLFVSGTPFQNHFQYRRYNLSGFLDQNVITDPDILPLDLFSIVQRSPGDRCTAELNRTKICDRSQLA